MKYLSQLVRSYLQNKTCLLRINLDIKDPDQDYLRIKAVMPTIEFLIDNKTKITILSHRGRPRGKDPDLSLKPLIGILKHKLSSVIGGKVHLDWLENLRFDLREEQNSDQFARELAAQGDIYVNDDFAVSHRAHASVSAITKYLPAFAGLLLEKEIKTLSQARDHHQKPLVIVIGGVKIEDKIKIIKNLHDQAQYFLLGSAYINLTNKLLQSKKVLLPEDWQTEGEEKQDIGPKTVKKFTKIIKSAKTVIWNGPLGHFENPKYLEGSKQIAQAIADSRAFSVIGGGDTSQLVHFLGLEKKFDFISTGGGAMLAFLAGEKLPGITALE